MTPIITVYWHGGGGRYLSVVAESLYKPTELIDLCSGHKNPSIPMLRFGPNTAHNWDLLNLESQCEIIKESWQALQKTTHSPIVHSQHRDLNLLLHALPNVNFLHIIAEPNDAADLAYNWYYKNLNAAIQDPSSYSIIKLRQQQDKNFILTDPAFAPDPAVFDNVDITDCVFWATIRAEVLRRNIQKTNLIPEPIDTHRIFKITWKDLKTGRLKHRLPELANLMGIELHPDREQNALQIIDQWTANQPQIPDLNIHSLV
jgi:hypothetical protein